MKTKHILALLDPRLDSSAAAQRAVDWAKRTGARLTLAVAEDHQTIVESGILGDALTRQAIDAWQEDIEGWLKDTAAKLETDGLEVSQQVIMGHPLSDKIIEFVAKQGNDMVIKDSHDEGALSRAFFTPLDWHLLRRCPVPLMLTKPGQKDGLTRIAAAVDPFHERGKPAELDQRILSAASDLSALYGADLTVIHACQTQPLGANSPLEGPSLQFEKVRDEIHQHHERALQELADDAGIDKGKTRFIDAPARRAIADYTRDEQVDLLVMGTVTRKGLTRLIMGSTAEAILGRLECDVLAIKPEGFKSS